MTDDHIDNTRYSRQSAFDHIGTAGQAAISKGRVLLIGCGALGTNIASTLVRAGVKSLHIADPDTVELSNLQRQTLFDESDAHAGSYKAQAAIDKLKQINHEVELSSFVGRFDQSTISDFTASDYDIILDGTDDIVARFLINQYAVNNKLPWVYGAVAGSSGLAAFFPPGGNPCLNCIFDQPQKRTDVDTAQNRGVISPVVTMTTSLQCAWAMKYLAGQKVQPELAHFDIWANQFAFSTLVSAGDKCQTCHSQAR